MLMMSLTLITAIQKLMNLVDEFGKGDCGENKAKKASASTKKLIRADHLFANHVSHTVSNSVKNVSNYLTSDAKSPFDQLHQTLTEAPIFQHFDPKQYIWVETDASGHIIGRVPSQLTNNSG